MSCERRGACDEKSECIVLLCGSLIWVQCRAPLFLLLATCRIHVYSYTRELLLLRNCRAHHGTRTLHPPCAINDGEITAPPHHRDQRQRRQPTTIIIIIINGDNSYCLTIITTNGDN